MTALGYTVSMLSHQTAVFLGLAILIHELMRHRVERVGLMRRLILTLVLPLLIVGMVYLIVGIAIGQRDPVSFWRWLTMHAQMGYWGHGTLSSATLGSAAGNLLNALVVRGFRAGWARWFFCGALGLGAVAALCNLTRSGLRHGSLVAASLVWIAALAGFSIWWDAEGAEYWGMVFLPVCLVLALIGPAVPANHRTRIPWSVLSRACFTLSLIPLVASAVSSHTHDLGPNEVREAARTASRLARDGDTIWAANTGNSTWYRIYLGGRPVTVLAIDVKPAREAARQSTSNTLTSAVIEYLGTQVRVVGARGGRCLIDRWALEGRISKTRLMRDLDIMEFTRALGSRFHAEPVGDGPDPFFHVLRLADSPASGRP